MKPFNLEQALAGKPLVTRDGRDARIICSDFKNGEYPLVVVISSKYDSEDLLKQHRIDGRVYTFSDSKSDLFMKPEKATGWIAIYQFKDNPPSITCLYKTREEALERFERFQKETNSCYTFLDIVEITYNC